MENFFENTYWMNSIQDYLIALGIIVGGILVIKIARRSIRKKLLTLDNIYVKYFMNLEKYIYPLTFLLIIYGGVYSLTLAENIRLFLHYAFTVGFIFLSIRVITAAVRTAIQSYLSGQDETGERLKQVRGIILILNVVLWIIGLKKG